MAISKNTKRRIITALSDAKSGNELIGAVGLYGGFRVNSDSTVQLSAGDVVAVADSGGAPGTYRAEFPSVNSQIQSIDWVQVDGFTPRSPTGVETCVARVTGYNKDATTGMWYVTVQIAKLADNTVDATPPAGFTIGVRVAVTLTPKANAL